jgi:hypothetical protein
VPTVCTDQTRPVIVANPTSPPSFTRASFLQEWGILTVIIFALATSLDRHPFKSAIHCFVGAFRSKISRTL